MPSGGVYRRKILAVRIKFREIAFFLLKTAIAVILVLVLILHNRQGLEKVFKSFDYGFLFPALGCYIIHIAASAWRWRKLAVTAGFELSVQEALSLTFQGYFFSLLLPAGAIGGDIVRITFLAGRTPSGSRWDGTMTILADRITGMAALFGSALVAICWNYSRMLTMPLPEWLDGIRLPALWTLILICSGGILVTILLFFHRIPERIPLLRKFFALSFFRRQ